MIKKKANASGVKAVKARYTKAEVKNAGKMMSPVKKVDTKKKRYTK